MSPTVQARITQELHRVRVMLLVIGLVLLMAVAGAGWMNEYRSCVRSQTIRDVSKTNRASNQRLADYWGSHGHPFVQNEFQGRVKASKEIKPLDCSGLLPEA